LELYVCEVASSKHTLSCYSFCYTHTLITVKATSSNYSYQNLRVQSSQEHEYLCTYICVCVCVYNYQFKSHNLQLYNFIHLCNYKSLADVKDFPVPSMFRPAMRPTQTPIQWIVGIFPGGKE
jgi:hypothetical protein